MKLGLTGYELKIYKSLLQSGTSTVGELSKNCDVPLTAIYPHIQKLVQKQLVMVLSGNIQKYKAINPKHALNSLYEENISLMEKEKDELINELTNLSKPRNDDDLLDITHGKDSSINWFAKKIDSVKEEVCIYGWRFSNKPYYNAFHKLMQLKKKGIKIKLILTDKNKNSDGLFEACQKENIPCKRSDSKNFSLTIIDNYEVKLTFKSRNLNQRYNLHFKDKDFVMAIKDYFDVLWLSAK